MNHKPAKRSSLFLMELMAAILFFLLSSAVCVRFFAKSHTLSTDAHNLNMAVYQTSAYAERFRAENDFIRQLKSDTDIVYEDKLFKIFYNSNWEICREADCCYFMEISISSEEYGKIQSANFTIKEHSSDENIYSITLDKYIPAEGDNT